MTGADAPPARPVEAAIPRPTWWLLWPRIFMFTPFSQKPVLASKVAERTPNVTVTVSTTTLLTVSSTRREYRAGERGGDTMCHSAAPVRMMGEEGAHTVTAPEVVPPPLACEWRDGSGICAGVGDVGHLAGHERTMPAERLRSSTHRAHHGPSGIERGERHGERLRGAVVPHLDGGAQDAVCECA